MPARNPKCNPIFYTFWFLVRSEGRLLVRFGVGFWYAPSVIFLVRFGAGCWYVQRDSCWYVLVFGTFPGSVFGTFCEILWYDPQLPPTSDANKCFPTKKTAKTLSVFSIVRVHITCACQACLRPAHWRSACRGAFSSFFGIFF